MCAMFLSYIINLNVIKRLVSYFTSEFIGAGQLIIIVNSEGCYDKWFS